jgi:hypothetical protein
MYIFGGIKFVSYVSSDYRALADVLISYQNDLELLNGAAIAGKANIVTHY